jgi:hypothetical protein
VRFLLRPFLTWSQNWLVALECKKLVTLECKKLVAHECKKMLMFELCFTVIKISKLSFINGGAMQSDVSSNSNRSQTKQSGLTNIDFVGWRRIIINELWITSGEYQLNCCISISDICKGYGENDAPDGG